MQDIFNVQDRIVIVTGGMGQLGRQFSIALAERGARVAIFDVRVDEASIRTRFGEWCGAPNLLFVQADILSRASLQAALAQVNERWGVPHALVNNAALDSPPNAPVEENGPFETYPEASWDQVMDVNVKGTFLCAQVIGSQMAEQGRGSIVNIASIYGLVSPNQNIYEYRRAAGAQFYKPVAYSVSKSAVLNLTRYLATYWASKNVRVNTATFAGVFNHQDEQFLASYNPHVPLGRMAEEHEYNGAIIFLVSDASSYMTGSNLIIDGGWTAW